MWPYIGSIHLNILEINQLRLLIFFIFRMNSSRFFCCFFLFTSFSTHKIWIDYMRLDFWCGRWIWSFNDLTVVIIANNKFGLLKIQCTCESLNVLEISSVWMRVRGFHWMRESSSHITISFKLVFDFIALHEFEFAMQFFF